MSIDELKRFKDYSDNLTLRNQIRTKLNVVSSIISYNADILVAILSDTTENFEIMGCRFKDSQEVFRIQYTGDYLQMSQIEQNDAGLVFAVAYQDNGVFFLDVFNNEGKKLDSLNVSDLTHLDQKSKGIQGFNEPMITAAFLPDDILYVGVYHRIQK